MSYTVNAQDTPSINFAPVTVVEEVLQNVSTIISTEKYQIPLDRTFGISADIVDLPMNIAQAKLSNEIFRAIRQYEPRAVVEGISFTGELNGKLYPRVEVSVNEA